MGTIAQKLAKLLATKADIKAAITEKGQTPGDVFSGYPAKIRAIQTGVDTSDATAVAGNIVNGKTAYAKGEKVIGTLPISAGAYSKYLLTNTITRNGDYFESEGPLNVERDTIVVGGGPVIAGVHRNKFGDATAADVASGKTFTSSVGLNVVGTASIQQSVTLTFKKNTNNKYASICARGRGYGSLGSSSPFQEAFPVYLNDVIYVVVDPGQSISYEGNLSGIQTITTSNAWFYIYQVTDISSQYPISITIDYQ